AILLRPLPGMVLLSLVFLLSRWRCQRAYARPTSQSHYKGAALMKVSLRKPISFSNSFSSYNGAVPILTWSMFTHSTGQPSPAVPWYRIYLSYIPFTCQRYHQRLTRPYVWCTGRDTLSR